MCKKTKRKVVLRNPGLLIASDINHLFTVLMYLKKKIKRSILGKYYLASYPNKLLNHKVKPVSFLLRNKYIKESAVTNQYQNGHKITRTNRMLFLTGLFILKLYYFV